MKTYTAEEWARAQYTGRWGDTPWNRDRVEAGELPASYIGRRYIMVNGGQGCTLLTEGAHFLVNDEEGRAIAKAKGLNIYENGASYECACEKVGIDYEGNKEGRGMRFVDFFNQRLVPVVHGEEYRCVKCADRIACPAANSGVCYPCPHYRKED